jgi:predicted phosphohydrolase
MKVAIASDLHLEFAPLKLTNTENADVLILAGDICVVKHLVNYLDFFKNCSEQFKHVLYVVGNHEHYNYMFNNTVKDLKEALSAWENIHVLDNEVFEVDNYTFIGSTLWTDMNNECPLTMNAASFAMPDFKIVKYNDGVNYLKYTPEQSVKEHRRSLQYIQQVMRNCNDKDYY